MRIVLKKKNQTYSPLIGDPCYRYNREAKEIFFKNRVACKVFLGTIPYLKRIFDDTDK